MGNLWLEKKSPRSLATSGAYLAPREGFEPPTKRLTAACSTAELPGNSGLPKQAPHILLRYDRRALNAALAEQGPPYNAVGKGTANVFFTVFYFPAKRRDLEAEAGIEPAYKDLQSSA